MPIVAIEGPDKCGKSTLYEKLKALAWLNPPQFVNPASYGKDRMHMAEVLSVRELEMWEALYDPSRLYVCNRHILITDAVYSEMYNRKKLRDSWLEMHLFVLYIDVPLEELVRRYKESSEDIQDPRRYQEARTLYWKALSNFQHLVISPSHTAGDVQMLIERMQCA